MYEDPVSHHQQGMGGADSQFALCGAGVGSRGHEPLIVSLTPLGPMGLDARRVGIPRSRWRCGGIPIPAGWSADAADPGGGGPTLSTATWSMPI